MSSIDDIKAKADANGDGKLTFEDLEHLKESHPEANDQLSSLQTRTDANDDGKVDLSDARGMLGDVMNNLGGMFGKK